MGIPLLSAVLGPDGVFYGSSYIVVFTIFAWTHGVFAYTEDRKQLSLKKVFLNPGVLGALMGLAMFFVRLRLPSVVSQAVVHVANLNTPLAMFVLGKYMTEMDFKTVFKKIDLYKIAFVKLILLPVIFIFVLKLLNVDEMVAKSILIASACPVATNAVLFANRFDDDAVFASEVASFTTLLAVLTIPLVAILM